MEFYFLRDYDYIVVYIFRNTKNSGIWISEEIVGLIEFSDNGTSTPLKFYLISWLFNIP